jgi:hypothetical protein
MDDLTDEHRTILELESSWWQFEGAKTTAIRERLGLTPARYYQLLNHLIDQPEALAHSPLVVKRLQRLRDQRREQRSARRLG